MKTYQKKLKIEREIKGITLIALVVTIIVLLILAAVAINLTIGNNGIFTRAKNATQKWEEASKNEQDEMDKVVDIFDEITSKVKDENPGILDGEGTEQKPYLVQSIEDLVGLSKGIETENYSGKYISLEVNLDFNSNDSYVDPTTKQFGDINGNGLNEELKIELTTGRGFPPIGNWENEFQGVFDGKNNLIKNLYINNDIKESEDGLFGFTAGSIIKNLTVTGEINSSAMFVGGIVGMGRFTNIENCKSIVNITAKDSSASGGIIGFSAYGASIINCINEGDVILKEILLESEEYIDGLGVGGVVGIIDNIIVDNCINYGNIKLKADGPNITKGEICGAKNEYTKAEIKENCKNNGNIEIEKTDESYEILIGVGGIVGFASPPTD